MRVAVIGTGSMGGRHAQLLAGMRGVDEVLVVDALPDRAATVAADIGARAVTHDEALTEADAVIVATPVEFHAATVAAAVERRIPVLCEKPLTEDLASSREIVALAERRGAHVEVGFHRRHDPGYAEGRRRVADGSAGRVHLVRLTAFDPLMTPRAPTEWTPNEAAPLFLHSSIHDFDFVRWITGQEVTEVSVDGSRRDEGRPDDPRAVETAVVTMRLAEGTLAVLHATWLHPHGYDNRAELVADHAHLTMGLSPRTPATHADWDGVSGEPWSGYLPRFESAYRAELVAFLAAARGEQPPASSARDGLEALRIAVAATTAYRERRTVPLAEI